MFLIWRRPSSRHLFLAQQVHGGSGLGSGRLEKLGMQLTDLELVIVEDLARYQLLWEVFADQPKETESNVGYDAFAKRQIEPYCISLALTFPSIRC